VGIYPPFSTGSSIRDQSGTEELQENCTQNTQQTPHFPNLQKLNLSHTIYICTNWQRISLIMSCTSTKTLKNK